MGPFSLKKIQVIKNEGTFFAQKIMKKETNQTKVYVDIIFQKNDIPQQNLLTIK